MNSSSPAHSSISTTAVVSGGGASNAAVSFDDLHFPFDPISTQERKDEVMLVLKSDIMAALDKEVKSLDEDNWKFEGPRSRINLTSRRGGGGPLPWQTEISKNWNLPPPK
ncbi:protein SAMBA [Lotus japonicus]|uniref:Protein SAMBA n=1 Tax=Lotus japonicus TaxID=34305 RepID=I3S0A0_LOTJA|nr:protein SAMBA [Lotus japonicus]AFK33692.1 unknown [Lotus japonicus]